MAALSTRPVSLREANAFVTRYHRHHPAARGAKFVVGVVADGVLVGVAIAGRPVARALDARQVLEVTRLCTDGTPNACSFLYGVVARIARALGYRRLITYTLAHESGVSLRASGWRLAYRTKRDTWDTPARRRTTAPTPPKQCWELILIP